MFKSNIFKKNINYFTKINLKIENENENEYLFKIFLENILNSEDEREKNKAIQHVFYTFNMLYSEQKFDQCDFIFNNLANYINQIHFDILLSLLTVSNKFKIHFQYRQSFYEFVKQEIEVRKLQISNIHFQRLSA